MESVDGALVAARRKHTNIAPCPPGRQARREIIKRSNWAPAHVPGVPVYS